MSLEGWFHEGFGPPTEGLWSGGVAAEKEFITVRAKGTVRWFSGAKGYSFIQRSTREDVFVHFLRYQGKWSPQAERGRNRAI